MTELGRQLIHAFTDGARGGNASYVIATSGGKPPDMQAECIRIARARGCEVTHLHLVRSPGLSSVRFYVAAGEIAFCGHGTLAAMAWACGAGWGDACAKLQCGASTLELQAAAPGVFGYLEPSGDWTELAPQPLLRADVERLLGLQAGAAGDVRVWLGGRTRAKAMIGLPSRALMARLKIQPELRDRFCRLHGVTGVYPLTVLQRGQIAARHFPMAAGDSEDLATGNIASTVAALLGQARPGALTIFQGGADCMAARLQVDPVHDGLWRVGGSCRHAD